jgi:putative membrane protein
MRTLNLFPVVLILLWSVQACNSGTKTTDSVKTATDTTEATTNVDDDLSDFMAKAASGGMMEVELGKTAQDNAKSQAVKNFGQMMVRDHTKANGELKALAATKNITLPTVIGKEHQEKVNDLITLRGAEFDEKYMNMMVDDHKEDIEHFQKAAKFKDAEISAFASKTLPVLQTHLDSAQAIVKRVKK